jgi:pimeloyl-ACP methyl ester carboxylesterase/quercetin dioxygenase-like cupin family protein
MPELRRGQQGPLDGFEDGWADVNGTRLHYVIGGAGPPLVLLPGYPLTWWQFHAMMPRLARHFRVIAVDLRGMGESDKPEGGYDKKTMAADVRELVRTLGHATVHVMGEDIGGMVAYSLAANHPEVVTKVAICESAHPVEATLGLPMFPSYEGAFHHWWVAFNQVEDLPEELLAGRFRLVLDWLVDHFPGGDPTAFSEEDRQQRVVPQLAAGRRGREDLRDVGDATAAGRRHLVRADRTGSHRQGGPTEPRAHPGRRTHPVGGAPRGARRRPRVLLPRATGRCCTGPGRDEHDVLTAFEERAIMAYTGQTISNDVTLERVTFVRTSEETGGAAVEMIFAVPAGGSVTAGHVHPRQSESFAVEEGRATFRLGRSTMEAGPGDQLTVAAGTPHAWAAVTDLRMMVTQAPGLGAEQYFEDVFALMNRHQGPPGRLDAAVLQTLYPGLGYPEGLAPPFVQRAVSALLAVPGRLLGRGPRAEDRLLVPPAS